MQDIIIFIMGGIGVIAGLICILYAIGWSINHNTFPVPKIQKPQFLGMALAMQNNMRIFPGWDKWFKKRVRIKNWDFGILECKMLSGDKYTLQPGDTILMPGRWKSVLVLVVLSKHGHLIGNDTRVPRPYKVTTAYIGSLTNVHR